MVVENPYSHVERSISLFFTSFLRLCVSNWYAEDSGQFEGNNRIHQKIGGELLV